MTTKINWTYRVVREDDEWTVVVRKNGVRYEPACYYAGDDKEDAVNTMAAMKAGTEPDHPDHPPLTDAEIAHNDVGQPKT